MSCHYAEMSELANSSQHETNNIDELETHTQK